MRKTYVALCCLALCLVPQLLTAEPTWRSGELKRLVEAMTIDTGRLSEGTNTFNVHGREVSVRCVNGQVQTVGYHIFSDEMRTAVPRAVADFLERYFLQMDYPQAERPASRMAREDRFRFITGSQATVATLLPDDGFALDNDGRYYTATWSRNGRTVLAVHFPASHELISGETKVEAEQNLEEDILQAVAPADVIPDEADLQPTAQPGFLMRKGNTHLNRLFASDLYYQRKDGALQLVADENHPLETVANMLTSHSFTPTRTMIVEQVMYGFKNKQFEISLQQWIAFCRSNGCQLYYGFESFDEQTVRATVIAVNAAENYDHVLLADIPMETLSNSNVPITARLDAYVPMHNVRNLLGQYKKTSKPKRRYEQ